MALEQVTAWSEPYRAALFETDKDKLPNRINAARGALVRHLQSINENEQRQERNRAIQALRMLELLQHVSDDASVTSQISGSSVASASKG